MKGPIKKNLSEHAVNLFSARWLMISASQLMSDGEMNAQEQSVSDLCHIYIITKLPSLSFSKDTFKFEEGIVSGHICYKIGGAQKEIPFSVEYPLLDGGIGLKLSDYPHREFETIDEQGRCVRYMPAHALCMGMRMHLEVPELNQIKVLYVGQSFGDGSRTAFDRLKSHSTLQKILADMHYSYPEDEVSVLTFEYCPYRVISHIDGRTPALRDPDNDSQRFYSILDNPLNEKQQVCLAEAGLIRFFQPKYNEIYKETFPLPTHKILEECYNLDFSGLVVEINTEDLGFKLFSDTVNPDYHHIGNINLVGHENRWGFFHFPDNEGVGIQMPDVITGR